MVGQMNKQTKCDHLEPIEEFNSHAEFERFLAWISSALDQGHVTEVPVLESYQRLAFPERWFSCGDCRTVWRLVHPDFPFKGLFLHV